MLDSFLTPSFFDVLDILLVGFLLYSVYRLVKGTAAINIFIGIAVFYVVWKLTQFLEMKLISNFLERFASLGMFALIVVFQQEIRKFLLLVGSANFSKKGNILDRIKFFGKKNKNASYLSDLVKALYKLSDTKTGALIVLQRVTNLDFVKETGDRMNIELNVPIIQSIFFKNSTLHDGAMIIEDGVITATRVILPVSNERNIPNRFGLRHRAAIGITNKTDALALVVSEETGQISYLKEGDFQLFENREELLNKLQQHFE